jgi:ADP-ribose pyrophosphatase YjhB (NUDIX family)
MLQREYPVAPIVAVGAVVLKAGQLLVVQRGHPPAAGMWSIPGGVVHLGERLEEAVRREIAEECGITVALEETIEVLDRITPGPDGRPRYHYVIIDYVARWTGGEARPGSDIRAVRWVAPEALGELDMTRGTVEVVRRMLARHALALARHGQPGGP